MAWGRSQSGRIHLQQAIRMSSARSSTLPRCARGEIWWAELSPTVGHEQSGRRPVLIVSADRFNVGHYNMVMVLPLTTRLRGWPTRIRIDPPEGGVNLPSEIQGDQLRALDLQRLTQRLGPAISPATMQSVDRVLRVILNLP